MIICIHCAFIVQKFKIYYTFSYFYWTETFDSAFVYFFDFRFSSKFFRSFVEKSPILKKIPTRDRYFCFICILTISPWIKFSSTNFFSLTVIDFHFWNNFAQNTHNIIFHLYILLFLLPFDFLLQFLSLYFHSNNFISQLPHTQEFITYALIIYFIHSITFSNS